MFTCHKRIRPPLQWLLVRNFNCFCRDDGRAASRRGEDEEEEEEEEEGNSGGKMWWMSAMSWVGSARSAPPLLATNLITETGTCSSYSLAGVYMDKIFWTCAQGCVRVCVCVCVRWVQKYGNFDLVSMTWSQGSVPDNNQNTTECHTFWPDVRTCNHIYSVHAF